MQIFYQIKFIAFLLLFLLYSRLAAVIISEEYILTDETSNETLQAIIENYLNNRIIWNQAAIEDIEQLPLKDEILISLIRLKRDKREIGTWQEFAQASGMQEEQLRIIKLFINVGKIGNYEVDYKFYNKFINDSTGVRYNKNCQKLRISLPDDAFLGGVTEWDEGEKDIWDYKNFTYRSPLLQSRYKIYAGNYKINWGYGLVLSNSLFSMMVANPSHNLRASTPKVYNSTSSNEAGHFFGTAVNIDNENFQFIPFYSRRHLDATIEKGLVKNISQTGLHVTQGQIDRRENLLQNQYGLAAVYNFGSNQLGLLNYSSLWGRSLETLGSRHLHMSSIYHKFQTGAWKLSGEYAFDYQGKYAIQSGLLYTPGKIKIGIGYRYFSPQLFGDMSSTIRHYSGRLKNEKGINLGLAFTLPAEIKFTGYIDFFSRVAPPNNGSPPPLGKESLVQLYKNFNSSYKIWLKYKQMYEIFHSDANFCSLKKQFKLKSHLEITHYLDLITRFIYNNLQTGNNEQNGLAISNSLEIDLNPINIIFGSSNFYTDSYESRVYLYEPGIPLRFNLPVLYGTGRRYFFTINYRINEIFLLYFVCSYAEQRKINQNKWNRKKLFELQLEINL